MAKMEKTRWGLHAILLVLLIAAILSSGCLSEPMEKVGNIFNPSSVKLFQEENYYQIDADELTTPVIPVQPISMYENKPDELSNNLPGFEISSYYFYTEFYEGSESVISVYVKNMGNTPVYVYQFGFSLLPEKELTSQDAGITILPGEEKNIGVISIEVPENVEELELQPHMSLLAQTKSDTWHDYKNQDFEDITIEVSQKTSMQQPEYVFNPESIFNQINDKIEPFNVEVRTMAAASAKKYPGQYNIYQICSLFDDTKENIQYISDPRGKDLWSTPGDTLKVGAGDCDDYAILLSSLIESIGGTSRIYLTDTHAFAAVYIGNNTKEIGTAIGEYYGPVPIYYTTDEYGSWLMMDPTSSIYAGGLPGGTAPTDGGWTFLNTTTVTVIDIAPQN
jgi:hypothetical protein